MTQEETEAKKGRVPGLVVAKLLEALLLGLALGALAVNKVEALGLGETVDGGTGEAREELLGDRVVFGVAVLSAVLLVLWHGNASG